MAQDYYMDCSLDSASRSSCAITGLKCNGFTVAYAQPSLWSGTNHELNGSMPVLIAYATHQGHTRVVAEYVAAALRVRDVEAEVVDVADPPPMDLTKYDAIVLAASVHRGRHQKEMVRFVQVFREELAVCPTAFLSVSMSETTAANDNNTPDARAEAAERVAEQVEVFFRETEWTADQVQPVAGALMYTEYGMVTRFVMKMIAKSTGAATDTSRDHVYTDFAALEKFASKLCDTVHAH